MKRCAWADGQPLMEAYHDTEWGVPLHDDRRLFEFLMLDTAQAGLSWLIMLKKREGYRRAFHDFDPERVAAFTEADVARLLDDPGIIRNRLKINAAITNARAFLQVREAFGSFDRYLWQFTDGHTRVNQWEKMAQVPTRSPESDAMSKDLSARGFKFVGTTICYAFMQGIGMVNDHTTDCFRHAEVLAGADSPKG